MVAPTVYGGNRSFHRNRGVTLFDCRGRKSFRFFSKKRIYPLFKEKYNPELLTFAQKCAIIIMYNYVCINTNYKIQKDCMKGIDSYEQVNE